MKLPHDYNRLGRLDLDRMALGRAIIERRNVIRPARDAKEDDRCWMDDLPIHAMLDDTEPFDVHSLSFEKKMHLCIAYHTLRNEDAPDPMPEYAIFDPRKWDMDLHGLTRPELFVELYYLQQEILLHRNIPIILRKTDDDRRLYRVLPENLVADFRLGSQRIFLGYDVEAKKGCMPFWQSHFGCDPLFCKMAKEYGPCVRA